MYKRYKYVVSIYSGGGGGGGVLVVIAKEGETRARVGQGRLPAAGGDAPSIYISPSMIEHL